MAFSVLSRFLQGFGIGAKIKKISSLDAGKKRPAGDLIIIDVRDPDEWEATGTPQGSYRIPMTDRNFIRSVEQVLLENPKAVAAISCQTGMRSKTAIKRLRKSIPRDFRILQDGVEAWTAAGLPLDQ